jgi:alkylated DNA repair dioxygenase AlkB
MTPKGKLVPQSPPGFMTDEWPHVFKRLEELKIFSDPSSSHAGPDQEPSSTRSHLPPNHCLVNEYNPGDGILPHLE